MAEDRVLLVLVWGALGWLAGLAMDRVIHAVPRDLPPMSRIRCEICGARVPVLDPRPRRTCARCGSSVPHDRVELPMAALFAALAGHFGLSGPLVAYSAYTAALVGIGVVDLRLRYVYTIMTLPAVLGSLLLTPVLTDVSVGATAAGLAVGALSFSIVYLAGRWFFSGQEPLAKGDIEVATIAGAMVGFPRIATALFLGAILNALIALALLTIRRRGLRDFIPYAPGLCVGVFLTFFLPSEGSI